MTETLETIVADLVSIPEAARIIGVTEKTAKRWAIAGTFPGDAARRQGMHWVVSVRKLRAYYHGETP